MLSRVTAKNVGDVFLETHCISLTIMMLVQLLLMYAICMTQNLVYIVRHFVLFLCRAAASIA